MFEEEFDWRRLRVKAVGGMITLAALFRGRKEPIRVVQMT